MLEIDSTSKTVKSKYTSLICTLFNERSLKPEINRGMMTMKDEIRLRFAKNSLLIGRYQELIIGHK